MPTTKVSDELDLDSLDDLIGQNWFFRTVTYFMVVKVKKRMGKFLVLEQASWIPDTGRFTDFVKNGISAKVEVEPIGMMIVNMDSIVDGVPWTHSLELSQQ